MARQATSSDSPIHFSSRCSFPDSGFLLHSSFLLSYSQSMRDLKSTRAMWLKG